MSQDEWGAAAEATPDGYSDRELEDMAMYEAGFTAGEEAAALASEPSAPHEDDLPPREFAHLAAFIEEWFCEIGWLDPELGGHTWCPEWWQHAAAIVRLESIWRSFEYLRQDPSLGISTWLKDHADYHMAVLMDANGPLKGCSVERGHDAKRDRVLSCTPAPTGLFHEDD